MRKEWKEREGTRKKEEYAVEVMNGDPLEKKNYWKKTTGNKYWKKILKNILEKNTGKNY